MKLQKFILLAALGLVTAMGVVGCGGNDVDESATSNSTDRATGNTDTRTTSQ